MNKGIPTIIAEVGFNHEGDMEKAMAMIRGAAEAGADAVKFQSFKATDLALPGAAHFELIRSGELSEEQHRELFEEARRLGLSFLSTPFSRVNVDLLERIGVGAYKVASMDLDNRHLLEHIAGTGKPVYLSTGMALLSEIAEALEHLDKCGAAEVTILHCIANYPAQAEELNLAAIPYLKRVFGVPVGYSDHYPGTKACLMAALLGAEVIETHFTLDTSWPGGDHAHSATPQSLGALIEDLRLLKEMEGEPILGAKRPDRANAGQFRRGLYAARNLSPGERLTEEDLLLCRPPSELSPNDLEWLLGREVRTAVAAHEPLRRSHIA